jgi:hypothetical protein
VLPIGGLQHRAGDEHAGSRGQQHCRHDVLPQGRCPLPYPWTIEFNDIGPAKIGVMVSSGSVVRNNFIHCNTNGEYLVWKASDIVFQGNQIAYNGPGQKIVALPPT